MVRARVQASAAALQANFAVFVPFIIEQHNSCFAPVVLSPHTWLNPANLSFAVDCPHWTSCTGLSSVTPTQTVIIKLLPNFNGRTDPGEQAV